MDFNKGISWAVWKTSLCLPVGAITAWLWFRASAGPGPAPSSPAKPASDSTRSTQRGVHLNRVNKDNRDTDIDIIAIHGLDTQSPNTWTWEDPRNPNVKVNWLADLLPDDVEKARIFTLDWPADLLQPSGLVLKTDNEIVTLLINGIDTELWEENKTRDRPILFIASCLGGIILMRALKTAADDNSRLTTATRGIIFLATPFRGTSFQEVAHWADPGLTTWAFICGRTVNKLLDSVKGSTSDLERLVSEFTKLCLRHPHWLVFNFYELGRTSLWRKLFPWLPGLFFRGKPLVDSSSARLDIVPDPLPLSRPHILMNKFDSNKCPDYKLVAGKIKEFIGKIREGTPLAQADAWIREKCYTEDRLTIERLSGTKLPMDQCYINLSIIERTGEDKDRSNKKSAKESVSQSSPFSLTARLKVETPDGTIQADLPSLFKEREGPNGSKTQPRRIFIRGRAGVGKTTLCKKIVYSFMRGEWPEWTQLFDRVLWVPLRNLKLEERRHQPGYNLRNLFSHEYFSRPESREDLARALSDTLLGIPEKRSRTLFLLDGLDEVSQDLSEGAMSSFLKELLEQPNVIITSRPYGKPPVKLDLELETVGFYPKQVKDYIQMAFNDPKTADRAQSFLESRSFIQGLMRIPVQLDALCFAWDNNGVNRSSRLDTMTDVYRAIDQSLWKKDIPRLGKKHDDKLVTAARIQQAGRTEVENHVLKEILFLESLAFTGLQNDIIEFESEHLGQISGRFARDISPSMTVPCLSFLRTSDSLAQFSNQTYHFLHLTYQEYFAARYFVRQWKANKPLEYLALHGRKNKNNTSTTAIQFFGENKYTARYDILWRFVAGLLNAEGKAEEFFQAIEDEPHDLLGPTHQRLVMHCLSEVSAEMSLRKRLEVKLKEWLLFEYKFTGKTRLASEVEVPESALFDTMQEVRIDEKIRILKLVVARPTIPPRIVTLVTSWLKDGEFITGKKDVLRTLQAQSSLSDELLTAVVARLGDKDGGVRWAALDVLKAQSSLSDELLTAVVARLEDEDWRFREAALCVLQAQSSLSDEHLTAVVARLGDKDRDVMEAALEILQAQSSLSDEHLTAVVGRLGDKDTRWAASRVLKAQSSLSDEHLTAVVARLEDEDWRFREAASRILQAQSSLSDELLTAVVARLGDKDGGVRKAALYVLQAQSSLSDELLTAVVARLGDKEGGVRWAALEILQAQSSLSDELLTAVVARLGDKHEVVRWAALQILQAQSSLSDDVLTALALLLESERAGDLAEALLRRYKEFYTTLLTGRFVEPLFKVLLRGSFGEQWSWYVIDKTSCVNMPEWVGRTSIDDGKEFMNMVTRARDSIYGCDERQVWSA
ncbi:nacht nucleoside triphosphatase [Pseudoneurospora amorphoporcata]|uniref:Nacht nucleoside triphosphatase n=1 Tax=Pseudoneurospora amorphoporcata TaxID=241081 RepID=A0AAN6NMH1_9PEZI|nr:nacht nucleoside triphosphatase [Pseudoneurospora amorphoporcata]